MRYHGTSLQEVLAIIGPAESSRIVQALRARGMSAEAARKRLSRAREPLKFLIGLRLPGGGRFWYVEKQFGTDRYWEQLVRALEDTGSSYGTALHGLHARGGMVPDMEFPIVCGSPAIPRRKQLTSATVAKVLNDIGLVEQRNDALFGPCVVLTGPPPLRAEPHSRRRATDIAEAIVIEAFADWAGNLGLVSPKAIHRRERFSVKSPEIAGYHWDLSGPSYIAPFQALRSTQGKAMHGFLAADVMVGRSLTAKHCSYFLKKCEGTRVQHGVRPLFPFLIADAFEGTAFSEGRTRGLIFATPRTLFGTEVAEAIRDLIAMLSNVTEHVADPEKFDRVVRVLVKTERAAQQLRGPLFELIVSHCVSYSAVIMDIGKNVVHPTSGEMANVDVLALKRGEYVLACECKGHRAEHTVRRHEVDDWLSRQVPRVFAFFQDHPEYRDVRAVFEMWTPGRFEPDALALLKDRSSEIRRYDIRWKDGVALADLVKSLRLAGISKILTDHFGLN